MVAGMRFKGRRISVGGSWGVLGARFGTSFKGSVALLGANMAEKSNKRARKVVSLNVPHALGEEKRRQEAAQGGQRGAKWRQNGSKNRI